MDGKEGLGERSVRAVNCFGKSSQYASPFGKGIGEMEQKSIESVFHHEIL